MGGRPVRSPLNREVGISVKFVVNITLKVRRKEKNLFQENIQNKNQKKLCFESKILLTLTGKGPKKKDSEYSCFSEKIYLTNSYFL